MEVRPSPAAPAPVDAPPVPAPAAPDVTPAPAAQAQADAAPRPFETPRVLFHVPGGDLPVIVEVADTPDTLERGLMFRESLPDGTGMIFVFPNRRDRSFWMKNTLIPLDMIYLDGDAGASEATVVGVVADAEPQTLTSRRCGRLSRWVVEVPGGYAAQHGIAPGVRATFVDMP
ncbi:MAG: DUF192 domain-containing protein [Deltaproteobacteria bacterium]|nr:DUF192 domain-containing protein [Deltaproteobacteria bacterium]